MQKFSRCILIFYCPLLLLGGCGTTNTRTVSTAEFQLAPYNNDQDIHRLTPGDSIEVSVEVDGSLEVAQHRAEISPLGYVTLPLVGDVQVIGLTVGQARSVIVRTYGNYYVHPPVVMVSRANALDEGEWGYVTVMGRIGTPGRIPLDSSDGMSLTEVIQKAGGFAASAKQNEIRVSRKDPDGGQIRVIINYEKIGQSGHAESDINLLAGDIVYVPERIF